jgi:hypothetical protein
MDCVGAFVAGYQAQAFDAGCGFDEAIGGIMGELVGELRREGRDLWGHGFYGDALDE